jgi:FtsP/CotA-like multicopper oxidase with cupredoxin domain
VTRTYNFDVTRSYVAPDGYNKSVILINGQFPGPVIEANWGDTISVTVTNLIETDTAEGLTLHWHGLTQKKTPWFDGVPGVSQCPIAPGKTFTYTFQADQYGTSWYHSHYSAQYNDGLYGPMVIHGPLQSGVSYDYDLGPVMLSDYTHMNYYDTLQHILSIPPVFPNVDNNLINGKGTYDCTEGDDNCSSGAGLARFNFTSGKTHRLRLINTGANANQKFSIDGHQLTVIANDYVPVKPYTTDVVTLGVGQRTDVLVKATGKPTDAVWMRSDIDMDCLNNTATITTALAAVYYQSANWTSTPSTTGATWQSNNCRNDPLATTVPAYPSTPPTTPGTVQTIGVSLGANATGHLVFFVNGISFRANYDQPVLLLAKNGNTSYPDSPEWNVYNFGSNSSVRLIFQNTFPMQHPLHLHGHNFWVLAEGEGEWDGTVTNPSNPQRRDTHVLAPGTPDAPTYLVLEWVQDNPGVWPLHCHMSFHVSAGLYLNVMVSCLQHDMSMGN